MGMEMVPKYAEAAQGGGAQPGFKVDPSQVQNLGVRTAVVTQGAVASGIQATGTIDFNQRDVAIIQPRAAGFVQRVYGRAPVTSSPPAPPWRTC